MKNQCSSHRIITPSCKYKFSIPKICLNNFPSILPLKKCLCLSTSKCLDLQIFGVDFLGLGLCEFRIYFSLSLMILLRGISDSAIGKCIHSDKNTPHVTETKRSVCLGGNAYEHKLPGASLLYGSSLAG